MAPSGSCFQQGSMTLTLGSSHWEAPQQTSYSRLMLCTPCKPSWSAYLAFCGSCSRHPGKVCCSDASDVGHIDLLGKKLILSPARCAADGVGSGYSDLNIRVQKDHMHDFGIPWTLANHHRQPCSDHMAPRVFRTGSLLNEAAGL